MRLRLGDAAGGRWESQLVAEGAGEWRGGRRRMGEPAGGGGERGSGEAAGGEGEATGEIRSRERCLQTVVPCGKVGGRQQLGAAADVVVSCTRGPGHPAEGRVSARGG
jgi:hypothetical protein